MREFQKLSVPNKILIRSKMEYFNQPHCLNIKEAHDAIIITRLSVDNKKTKFFT